MLQKLYIIFVYSAIFFVFSFFIFAYYVSGIVIGARNKAVNKEVETLCLQRTYFLVGAKRLKVPSFFFFGFFFLLT